MKRELEESENKVDDQPKTKVFVSSASIQFKGDTSDEEHDFMMIPAGNTNGYLYTNGTICCESSFSFPDKYYELLKTDNLTILPITKGSMSHLSLIVGDDTINGEKKASNERANKNFGHLFDDVKFFGTIGIVPNVNLIIKKTEEFSKVGSILILKKKTEDFLGGRDSNQH